MEKPNVLKKKWIAVLKAAIWGVAIFEAIIAVTDVAYAIWGKEKPASSFKDFLDGFGTLLTILAAMLSSEKRAANIYVVNGLLGAGCFALVAAVWQFGVKNQEKQ